MKILIRAIPNSFAQYALRSDTSKLINHELAKQQHHNYCSILEKVVGSKQIIHVPPANELADSLFIEDTVVMVRKSRFAHGFVMNAKSRLDERSLVHQTLIDKCQTELILHGPEDGTLDGGDVLYTGSSYIVGISKRTSLKAANVFKSSLKSIAPQVPVEIMNVPFGLHLKSLCTMCGPRTIVAAKDCGDEFIQELKTKSLGMDVLIVPDTDAANCLWIEEMSALIIRKDYPKSALILREHANRLGVQHVYECDVSEIAKADGALTCCSVVVD